MGLGELMFRESYACEDLHDLPLNEMHMVVRWCRAPVFFSFCKKGEALSAHFSAFGDGLRLIKQAIEDFCQWAFEEMPWCKMIFALILRPSVVRLVLKCGFSYLGPHEDAQAYVRYRTWEA